MNGQTHPVLNQFDELQGYNVYTTDAALCEAVVRQGGDHQALAAHGAEMGSVDSYRQAELANRHPPQLKAFDARGRRMDVVDFHPAWHHWLRRSRAHGLHASPFTEHHARRWIEWAARFYMHAQIESGSECPTSMTLGAIPLLQREPALWRAVGHQVLDRSYDAIDGPLEGKRSAWIGMGMTEKQGGSDVRSNLTIATPTGNGGRGGEYLLRGHKWFFRRRCAMPTWWWRAPLKTDWLAFTCRAGVPTAAKTACTSSDSKTRSATRATPAAKLNLSMPGACSWANRGAAFPPSSRWPPTRA